MTVLKLDGDSPRYPARWFFRAQWLARRMGWRIVYQAMSRSTNGGWHGELGIAGRVPMLQVIAAQAIIGSDWAREAYNLRRATSPAFAASPLWRQRTNVLYERHFTVRLGA